MNMFGRSERKFVAVTEFRSGGLASVASHFEGKLTKKEMLRRVAKWWDNHGTGFNDYDGIQVKMKSNEEVQNGEAAKGD